MNDLPHVIFFLFFLLPWSFGGFSTVNLKNVENSLLSGLTSTSLWEEEVVWLIVWNSALNIWISKLEILDWGSHWTLLLLICFLTLVYTFTTLYCLGYQTGTYSDKDGSLPWLTQVLPQQYSSFAWVHVYVLFSFTESVCKSQLFLFTLASRSLQILHWRNNANLNLKLYFTWLWFHT